LERICQISNTTIIAYKSIRSLLNLNSTHFKTEINKALKSSLAENRLSKFKILTVYLPTVYLAGPTMIFANASDIKKA